ncbi:MAG: glycosyltransferase [Phycisphaerales bacterium]|nr:glycosyltransferase [Phycisphaerales bacterium]
MSDSCTSQSRLLFAVSSLDVGGAERYLLRLVRFLVDRGWRDRIDVVCKSGRRGVLAEDYEASGARVIPIKQGYFDPAGWWKLRRFMSRGRYQAYCDFTDDFAGIPLTLAALTGIPRRISFYRHSKNPFPNDPLRLLYWKIVHRLTLASATSLLSNSAAAFDFFCRGWRANQNGRYEVIRNGIESKDFQVQIDRDVQRQKLGISKEKLIIGHLARYDQSKNHPTILKVAKLISQKRKNIVFLLCGRDVTKKLLQSVTNMGLQDVVYLSEARSDVPQVLKCLDAFYFPSLWEGQPNALLEAILAGVPFIASNIAPHREAVPPWAYDRLVPTCDAELAANRLITVLDHPEQEQQLAEQMTVWAKEAYDPDRCFGAVLPHLGIVDK